MNFKMKTTQVVDVGGFIAVVIGLIFVGLELRQNTDAVKAQTIQEVQRDVREHLLLGGELFDIRSIPASDRTEAQQRKVRTHWLVAMRSFENQWYHYDRGFLDPEIFEGYARHLYIQLGNDTERSWWEARRDLGFFHPGFVDYVENSLLTEMQSLNWSRLAE